MGFEFRGSASQPWQFPVSAYGAKGDGEIIIDATIAGGSLGTVTSASNPWTADDVGKPIMIQDAHGGSGATHITTIATFVGAGSITLTVAATSAVSGVAALWGTDDTVAIQNAAAALAASSGFLNEPYYAELVFAPAIYCMAGATVKGGSTYGNAHIPIPVPDVNDQSVKRTVVYRGSFDNSTVAFWTQVAPQMAGTCIVSMLNVVANDPTWGPPSVIGGPTVNTPFPGSGQFNNVLAIVDGISVMCPQNPGQIAFDFYLLCQYAIHTASALVFWSPNGLGHTPLLSNAMGLGLRTSQFGSNNRCDIGSLTVAGYYYGMTCDQHVACTRALLLYTNTGVYIPVPGGATLTHGCWFGYLSIESCAADAIHAAASAGTSLFALSVSMLDTEGIGGNDVYDPLGALTGNVLLLHNGSGSIQTPVVNGAANLEIISVANATGGTTVRGSVAAPSVPATTVALVNPFWRHALVVVSGGTVTAIAVDGTATGLIAGTVIVPSGKTITLTYSVAPTWDWVLL